MTTRHLVIFMVMLTGMLGAANHCAAVDVYMLNAMPERLSNSIHINKRMRNLDICNVVIKNMTFHTVNAEGAKFTNVTFQNCKFINCRMRYSYFENVAFKNCVFEGRGDPQFLENITNFQYSTMIDVLFENTRMRNAWFEDIRAEGGYICFRNMRDFSPRGISMNPYGTGRSFGGGSFFSARKAHIRMIDSNLEHAVLYGGSVWVRDSTFKNSTLDGIYAYVENVSMDEGMINGKILRAEKCDVKHVTFSYLKNCYLLYNTYRAKLNDTGRGSMKYLNSAVDGLENAYAVVLDNNSEESYLDFGCGNVQLNNIKLVSPRNYGVFEEQAVSQNFDMCNVKIVDGWDIYYYRALKGRWENVDIEGPITLENGNLENIEAHNLRYEQDKTQFKDATSTIKITQRANPFQWEEPKIPTPQEIGHKFWPDVDPGYHP